MPDFVRACRPCWFWPLLAASSTAWARAGRGRSTRCQRSPSALAMTMKATRSPGPRGPTDPSILRPRPRIPATQATIAAEPISGFAQLHSQGSGGVTTYGTFLLSPQVGPVQFDETAHLSPKADEVLAADAYSVRLTRYDTARRGHAGPLRGALSPELSDHGPSSAGLRRHPQGRGSGRLGPGRRATLPEAEGKIVGHVKAKGYWNPALIDIWFVAKFDHKPTPWGVFDKQDRKAGATEGQDRSGPTAGRLADLQHDRRQAAAGQDRGVLHQRRKRPRPC
jgi:hypothetical protein